MREHELQQLLGGLATRLDEATEPVDIDIVLRAPQRRSGAGRRSKYVLSVAALVALIAAITWAWPTPQDDGAVGVRSGSSPTLELLDVVGPARDEQLVQVAGAGFHPDTEISLRQCVQAGCDEWRPPTRVTADGDGRFAVDVVLYHDIALGRGTTPGSPVSPDWLACSGCVLRADGDGASASTPLELMATEQPSHPSIDIGPAPEYSAGYIQVTGSGFRPDPDGLDIGIAFCAADAPRSEECSGGPELGDLSIEPDGSFVANGMALPAPGDQVGGVRCDAEPGACVVTWFLKTSGPLPVGVPLDLSEEGFGS